MPILDPRLQAQFRPELGICQWFHYGDDVLLERSVRWLRELGVVHLRTGISWADYHRPRGQEWYDRQMEALSGFDVTLCLWHTPPSIAEGSRCSGPPRRLQDFADFVWTVIDRYGPCFGHLELWNEPNNRLKWNFVEHDPAWEKFALMLGMAANTAHMMKKRTVLGGISPIDPQWIDLMIDKGALEHVDVLGVHGFPGMCWKHGASWDWYGNWPGWKARLEPIAARAGGKPIWITESGLSTWCNETARTGRYRDQRRALRLAARAPAERMYWYSLVDLAAHRPAIEGFHVDENEYHMGLVDEDGVQKPAWDDMRALLAARPPSPRSTESSSLSTTVECSPGAGSQT
jgi:CDP-paratose 2-epimerase